MQQLTESRGWWIPGIETKPLHEASRIKLLRTQMKFMVVSMVTREIGIPLWSEAVGVEASIPHFSSSQIASNIHVRRHWLGSTGKES